MKKMMFLSAIIGAAITLFVCWHLLPTYGQPYYEKGAYDDSVKNFQKWTDNGHNAGVKEVKDQQQKQADLAAQAVKEQQANARKAAAAKKRKPVFTGNYEVIKDDQGYRVGAQIADTSGRTAKK